MRAELPLPQCSGFEGFWDRFQFSDDVRLCWAESNSLAVAVPGEPWCGWDQVYPSPLVTGEVRCEDWMVVLDDREAELHMRYPQWRSRGVELEPEPEVPVDRAVDDGVTLDHVVFDAVFVCRSGAWVPPWCDMQFARFLESFLPAAPQRLDADLDVPMIRDFNIEMVRAEAEAERAALEVLRSEGR